MTKHSEFLASSAPQTRKRTSLTIRPDYLAEAKALDVNISRAAEQGLEQAIKIARGKQWQAENRKAMEGYNNYLEEHGLPLAGRRLF